MKLYVNNIKKQLFSLILRILGTLKKLALVQCDQVVRYLLAKQKCQWFKSPRTTCLNLSADVFNWCIPVRMPYTNIKTAD